VSLTWKSKYDFGRITISIGLAYIRYSAQHSDVFLITSCVRKRRALDALGPVSSQ